MTGRRRVGGPARGAGSGSPKAPAFTAGNVAAVRHGAGSPRVVAPLAAAIVATAVADAPYLSEGRYQATVQAWARTEAMAALLDCWLTEHGLHDAKDRLRPAEAALHRCETRAANLRSRLGLDPLSAARLGRDVAATRGLLDIWDETEDTDGEGDGDADDDQAEGESDHDC